MGTNHAIFQSAIRRSPLAHNHRHSRQAHEKRNAIFLQHSHGRWRDAADARYFGLVLVLCCTLCARCVVNDDGFQWLIDLSVLQLFAAFLHIY